jgi:hypothetical protein
VTPTSGRCRNASENHATIDTAGRYQVGRHFEQWAVWDLAYVTPSRVAAGPFEWQADAETAAAELNRQHQRQTQPSHYQPRLDTGDAA